MKQVNMKLSEFTPLKNIGPTIEESFLAQSKYYDMVGLACAQIKDGWIFFHSDYFDHEHPVKLIVNDPAQMTQLEAIQNAFAEGFNKGFKEGAESKTELESTTEF